MHCVHNFCELLLRSFASTTPHQHPSMSATASPPPSPRRHAVIHDPRLEAPKAEDAQAADRVLEHFTEASERSDGEATPLATTVPPPPAEDMALLMSFAALADASALRAWVERSPDSALTSTVRAIRALHSSWLLADGAMINLSVELSLLKQERAASVKREDFDCRSSPGVTDLVPQDLERQQEAQRVIYDNLIEQLSASHEALEESEQRAEALRAELAEKSAAHEKAVSELTAALEEATLEQKRQHV